MCCTKCKLPCLWLPILEGKKDFYRHFTPVFLIMYLKSMMPSKATRWHEHILPEALSLNIPQQRYCPKISCAINPPNEEAQNHLSEMNLKIFGKPFIKKRKRWLTKKIHSISSQSSGSPSGIFLFIHHILWSVSGHCSIPGFVTQHEEQSRPARH